MRQNISVKGKTGEPHEAPQEQVQDPEMNQTEFSTGGNIEQTLLDQGQAVAFTVPCTISDGFHSFSVCVRDLPQAGLRIVNGVGYNRFD